MTLINLIPAEIKRAAARRLRIFRWGVVVVLAGVLAAVPYSLTLARDARVATLREEIDQLDQDAASVKAQLRLATGRAQQLFSERERSKALRAKRAWSGMFALIASCLPSGCWLHSVATDPESPAATVARPPVAAVASGAPAAPETVTIEAPQKLRLIGFSTNDSQPLVFVGNLRETKAFARVALQKALRAPSERESGDETLYQFEVVCEW